MKYNKENVGEAAEFLSEMASYEETELGETWTSIFSFWEYSRNYITKNLREALEKEIIDIANDIDQNYKLVETEYQQAPVVIKELIHKDDE